MKKYITPNSITALLVLCLLLTTTTQVQAEEQTRKNYQIAAGSLTSVLNRFALETGVSVLFDPAITRNRNSTGLHGEYRIEEGFSLLLRGTGLSFRVESNGQQVTVYDPAADRPNDLPADVLVLQTLQVIANTSSTNPQLQIYEHADGTSIIGRTEIDRTGPRHASEILQATPGVATVTNEQNPAVAVQIRGLKDFGRVNMNIDGMRQNFQRSGHQQRNGEMFFDTEFLAGVEISKGPSSDVGGAGATGGVATFRTIEADDLIDQDERSGGRLRGSTGVAGWANGQELSGSLAVAARPTDNTDILFAYSQKNSGEYEPGQEGEALLQQEPSDYSTPANIVNGTSQNMESILFKTGWNITDHQRLKFTFTSTEATYKESSQQDSDQAWQAWQCTFQSNIDAGYCDDFEYDSDNVYPISSTNRVENKNYALDYQYLGNNPYIDLAAKGYFVTTKNDYESIDENVHSKTQTDTIGGFIKNKSYLNIGEDFGIDLQVGLEGFKDKTSPETGSTTLTGDQIESANGVTPEGNRYIVSAFSSAVFHYSDWLEITPGLRYDQYRLWGIASYQTPGISEYLSVDVNHTKSKWLPTLGIAVTPWQPLQLFANAGLGWRPPAITETLISGASPGHTLAVDTYPNWNLKPEETQSLEIGLNLNFNNVIKEKDSVKLKLVHFKNDTENYIYLANSIGTPGAKTPSLMSNMYANSLDTITFKGEELSLDYNTQAWYLNLQITRMKREGNLVTTYYPAGGAPDDYYENTLLVNSSLYYPIPPEYTGALSMGTHLFSKTMDIGMQWRYTDKSGNPNFNDLTTGTRVNYSHVFDLYSDWKINQDFSAGFNIKNITDRQYIMAQGDAIVRTYAPGRTLTANIQWKF